MAKQIRIKIFKADSEEDLVRNINAFFASENDLISEFVDSKNPINMYSDWEPAAYDGGEGKTVYKAKLLYYPTTKGKTVV